MTTYWLDLFTGTTWSEFRNHGAMTSGFRGRKKGIATQMKEGDILLCYLTGVKLWVGALKILGPSKDKSEIWSEDEFPVRFKVEPIVVLEPELGVPMSKFEGKLAFYTGPDDRGGYKGFLRGSPSKFKKSADGDLILTALKEAEKNPVKQTLNKRLLNRKYRLLRKQGKKSIETLVTIPEAEVDQAQAEIEDPKIEEAPNLHTAIQHLLLTLGTSMGLEVWVAQNDKGKVFQGHSLGSLPQVVDKLPTQFNEATNKTIEMIDVLWLQGNTIMAAFEVESTTSIYSGLLRMSDLLALQPNVDIRLFIAAPEERRSKVEQEIRRPTFTLREKPLNQICGFLSFGKLQERVKAIQAMDLGTSLKPDFLQKMAEYFTDED